MEMAGLSWFATTGYTSASPEMQSTPILDEGTSFSSLESSTYIGTPLSYDSHHKTSNSTNFSVSFCCIASLKTSNSSISSLALHENTLYAASNNHISVFDLTTYSLLDTFTSKQSDFGLIKFIALSDDGKIFTAHQDCKIRVWQVKPSQQKHQLITTLPTLKDQLRRCMLAKNYVQVRRHRQKLWIQHADTVSGLAINDGLMYSSSWDKSFKIWRLSDMSCMESVTAHSDAVNAIAVSPDGTVYTASADGYIKVWEKGYEAKKHTLLATLEKHNSSVNALALSPNGLLLYSGGGDQMIIVWSRDDSANHMTYMWSLIGHRGAILCLVQVNGVLISGSSDKTLRVWQQSKDSRFCCLAILEGHCKPVKSLVAASDKDLDDTISVFSGCLDGEIRVWNIVIADETD